LGRLLFCFSTAPLWPSLRVRVDSPQALVLPENTTTSSSEARRDLFSGEACRSSTASFITGPDVIAPFFLSFVTLPRLKIPPCLRDPRVHFLCLSQNTLELPPSPRGRCRLQLFCMLSRFPRPPFLDPSILLPPSWKSPLFSDRPPATVSAGLVSPPRSFHLFLTPEMS